MDQKEIVLKIPNTLYEEILQAQNKLSFPDITDLVRQAIQHYLVEAKNWAWREDFIKLQQSVIETGGFNLGKSKEEIISNLREQRQEIFETEYENMY